MNQATTSATAALAAAQARLEAAQREVEFANAVTAAVPVQPKRSSLYHIHGRVGSIGYDVKTLTGALEIFQAFADRCMLAPICLVRDDVFTSFYTEQAVTDRHRICAYYVATTKPWTSLDAQFSFYVVIPDLGVVEANVNYPLELLGRHVRDDYRKRVHYRYEWRPSKYMHQSPCVVYGGSSQTGEGSAKTPVYGFDTVAAVKAFLGQEVDKGN